MNRTYKIGDKVKLSKRGLFSFGNQNEHNKHPGEIIEIKSGGWFKVEWDGYDKNSYESKPEQPYTHIVV